MTAETLDPEPSVLVRLNQAVRKRPCCVYSVGTAGTNRSLRGRSQQSCQCDNEPVRDDHCQSASVISRAFGSRLRSGWRSGWSDVCARRPKGFTECESNNHRDFMFRCPHRGKRFDTMDSRFPKWLRAMLYIGIALLLSDQTTIAIDYYVNSQIGDDSYPGTSLDKPWQSLEKVNTAHYSPGDSIRFVAGSRWSKPLSIKAEGKSGQWIVFEAHGVGPRPRIEVDGSFEDALIISNAQHVIVRGFEVTNQGLLGSGTNTPPRRGIHVVADNAGTLTNITISDCFIHHVNGTQRFKHNGGIIFSTRGERVPSRFDGLRIERNIVWRVDRSGIVAQSFHARRNRWFPSLHVVVQDNWLGDIGGDGITPWATDGCLVEHNVVQGANERAGTYNAGIWPWSTDNTVIRLNRASGVKTLLDGQGFDSDYNSRNTLLEYNLSHDNEGGFLLVCTPGRRNSLENCGNVGTLVRYNISRHDQARAIHVAGAPEQTRIWRNAIYTAPRSEVQLLLVSDWDGWVNGLELSNNLLDSGGIVRYGHQSKRNYHTGAYEIAAGWSPATNVVLAGNACQGQHEDFPPAEVVGKQDAPQPIEFSDWPGPQFDPGRPAEFPAFIQAHRAWMLRLMKRQFGTQPSSDPK